jgi:hypothetical protein
VTLISDIRPANRADILINIYEAYLPLMTGDRREGASE